MNQEFQQRNGEIKMNKYEKRIEIIEYNTGEKLTDDEKLQLAFEMQCWQPFVELLEKGTNGKQIYDIAKKMGSWKLSMLQCDMLKEVDKYMKR